MRVGVLCAVRVGMFVSVLVSKLHLESHAGDVRLLSAGDADLPSVKLEFFQFLLQRPGIDAQVEHGTEEHVAADAAENVEIQCLHKILFALARRSLAWRHTSYRSSIGYLTCMSLVAASVTR